MNDLFLIAGSFSFQKQKQETSARHERDALSSGDAFPDLSPIHDPARATAPFFSPVSRLPGLSSPVLRLPSQDGRLAMSTRSNLQATAPMGHFGLRSPARQERKRQREKSVDAEEAVITPSKEGASPRGS